MRYIFLLGLLLTLSACQGLETRSDERRLELALSSYGMAVRWQSLEALYAFLEPELRPQSLPGGLQNVRVTGYEITSAPREIADGKVAQSALIEYVLVDRQAVHRLVDNQLWQRNADGEWLRANPIPTLQ